MAKGGASSPLILMSKRTSLSSRNPISVKDIEAYPLVRDLSFFFLDELKILIHFRLYHLSEQNIDIIYYNSLFIKYHIK